MGIDELLNFIESKDNKKNNNSKKAKKKTVNPTSSKKVNENINSNSNSNNSNKMIIDNEKSYEKGVNQDDDSELEQFKNKILGDSIDANVIKKIKPNFTAKWD